MLAYRWDVLVEILEAQKQRISSLGIEFKSVSRAETEKQSRLKKGENEHVLSWFSAPLLFPDRDISPDEAVSSKKRKVTSSRRISFESSYARISSWAEHILSRLQDGVSELALVDQQFLHEETEAEVKGEEEKVEELISLGQQLVKGKFFQTVLQHLQRVEVVGSLGKTNTTTLDPTKS